MVGLVVVAIALSGCETGRTPAGQAGRAPTGTDVSPPPTSVSASVPAELVGPARGLDWSGFVVAPGSACGERTVADGGRTQLTVSGSATVPPVTGHVAGEVEMWAESLSGVPLGHGSPWPLPSRAGTYRWRLRVSVPASSSPTRCVVQGIDPDLGVAGPQGSPT